MFDNTERHADNNRKNMFNYTMNFNPVYENSNFWSSKHTHKTNKQTNKQTGQKRAIK